MMTRYGIKGLDLKNAKDVGYLIRVAKEHELPGYKDKEKARVDTVLPERTDGIMGPEQAQRQELIATKRPVQRVVDFNGLPVNVEIEIGETKRGTDSKGNQWSHEYKFPYGEILKTEGEDGDPVDVYLGPDHNAAEVYIVHQLDHCGQFDEDKVFLGFSSKGAAEKAYRDHGPEFGLGSIDAMDLNSFKTGYLAANRPAGHLQNSELTNPSPKAGESEKDYIARFMGSEEANRDYPDPKQRAAVAYSMFRSRKNTMDLKNRVLVDQYKHYAIEQVAPDKFEVFLDTSHAKPYEFKTIADAKAAIDQKVALGNASPIVVTVRGVEYDLEIMDSSHARMKPTGPQEAWGTPLHVMQLPDGVFEQLESKGLTRNNFLKENTNSNGICPECCGEMRELTGGNLPGMECNACGLKLQGDKALEHTTEKVNELCPVCTHDRAEHGEFGCNKCDCVYGEFRREEVGNAKKLMCDDCCTDKNVKEHECKKLGGKRAYCDECFRRLGHDLENADGGIAFKNSAKPKTVVCRTVEDPPFKVSFDDGSVKYFTRDQATKLGIASPATLSQASLEPGKPIEITNADGGIPQASMGFQQEIKTTTKKVENAPGGPNPDDLFVCASCDKGMEKSKAVKVKGKSYCPDCASEIDNAKPAHVCDECGHTIDYHRPVDKQGKVDPNGDKYGPRTPCDFPGGCKCGMFFKNAFGFCPACLKKVDEGARQTGKFATKNKTHYLARPPQGDDVLSLCGISGKLGVDSEIDTLDDSMKNSYGDEYIKGDIKSGMTDEQIAAKIQDRYRDIPKAQALGIAAAVRAGKRADWSKPKPGDDIMASSMTNSEGSAEKAYRDHYASCKSCQEAVKASREGKAPPGPQALCSVGEKLFWAMEEASNSGGAMTCAGCDKALDPKDVKDFDGQALCAKCFSEAKAMRAENAASFKSLAEAEDHLKTCMSEYDFQRPCRKCEVAQRMIDDTRKNAEPIKQDDIPLLDHDKEDLGNQKYGSRE